MRMVFDSESTPEFPMIISLERVGPVGRVVVAVVVAAERKVPVGRVAAAEPVAKESGTSVRRVVVAGEVQFERMRTRWPC